MKRIRPTSPLNNNNNGDEDDTPTLEKRPRLVDYDSSDEEMEETTPPLLENEDGMETADVGVTPPMKRAGDFTENEIPNKRKSTDRAVYCETCETSVTKSNWSRHIKSSKHVVLGTTEEVDSQPVSQGLKRKVIDVVETHGMKRKTPDGGVRCEKCDSTVSKSNWARHLQSPKHRGVIAVVSTPTDQPTSASVGNEMPTTVRPSTSGVSPTSAPPRPTARSSTKVQHDGRRRQRSAAPQRPTSPKPSTSAYDVYRQHRVSTPAGQPDRQRRVSTLAGQSADRQRVTRSSANRTHQQQQQPVSLKIPCPVCGKHVLPRSMNRHQQSSKRCLHSYEIVETRSFSVKKYGATGVDYTIKVNVVSQVEPAIDRMIAMAKEKSNYSTGDVIIVVASHPQFRHDISSKVSSSGVNARSFANHVERIISSNETFDITSVRWNVKIINVPRGRANTRRMIDLARDVRTKKCILRIRNDKDDMCGARAVVTALTYHRDTILGRPLSDLEKKYVRKGRRLQTTLAEELCTRLGGYTAGGFTLEDFARTERFLVDVQIKIVSSDSLNTIVYEGDEADTVLYLYKTGDHFDVITSMRAFFGSCYYCERCDTPYRNKNRHHRCKKTKVCHMCSARAHAKLLPETYCDACDRYCYDDECLAAHRQPGGVCDNWYKCSRCNLVRARGVNHGCGSYKCRNCLKFADLDEPHRCHVTMKIQKGGHCGCVECDCYCGDGGGGKCTATDGHHRCTYTEKYLFFDYEAIQESGVHEANYVHVKNFNGDLSESFNDNVSFCRWLLTDDHKGYTCIAHNAKGYDSHFILRYCVENAIAPKTVYTGTKLMELVIPGLRIRVIDSMNFVAEPLSAFPKTFGLTELKKGFFPHLFNTRANQDYVGPIPDAAYYSPDTMKLAVREEFLKWHAERRGDPNYVFHFRRELEEYCKSDVDILRRGCLTLRNEFLKIANIDPFCYMTIASVCMAVYRSKYLQPDTLAVVESPDHEASYTKESIAWLTGLVDDDDEEDNNNIRHALNGGEVFVCGAKVDGYCAATKTVYQFHGCFWHGCVKCYDPTLVNRKNRHTMGDLYMRTKRRTQQLRDAGYRVVEMWECEWSPRYRRLGPSVTTVVEPGLNPRDAFFGGRTNACKLRVTGKKLRYIDVVSLYPTVMFYDRYPVGHPISIDSPGQYDYNWFGLVKCRVLPPAGLYHPVLPLKLGKLVFPLCAACAVEKCRQCRHDVNERALTGTWTTIEIRRALQKGYRIMKIYSVMHFPKTSTDLFGGYVKDFLKIKLETSDWRKDFLALDDYVNAVRQSNDIELDPERIATNPGKRAVAKICLNSLWGKFGQRQNMSQTRYVVDPSEFYKTLLDTRLDKTNVTFVNENVAQIVYNKKSTIVEDPNNINIFVAVFTTAHARLRLYDMMDRLGENVAYYDTDSIVYIDDDVNKVRTGCMLGDWNDELGAEDWITDWVSTGPKSYAYETAKNRGTCKIKGFTLNYRNSQNLNMCVMKSLLAGDVSRTEIVYDQICRDKVTKKLVNKSVRKTFKMDYDKRMIVLPDETRREEKEEDTVVVVDTLPWGYTVVNK